MRFTAAFCHVCSRSRQMLALAANGLAIAAIILSSTQAHADMAHGGAAASSRALQQNGTSANKINALWDGLIQKLQSDGLNAAFIHAVFSRLNKAPSPKPMGLKITELYSNHFLPKPRKQTETFETELGIPGPWFNGVVSMQNARLCKNFMEANATAFALAEIASGVPQEIAAALLFVETRLGEYLGKDNAFYMLASMSTSRDTASLAKYLDKLPGAYEQLEWIQGKMNVKADWAYKELKALLEYCSANGMDPLSINGSMYGAIGLCQFMPSNIKKRGIDGDRDGKIDLFNVSDAVSSLSNYLQKSGWQNDCSLEKKIKVLRSYNAMNIYARTILALAETIRRCD